MKRLLFTTLMVLFLGLVSCKTDKAALPGNMRFSEYTGKGVLDWETSQGALADTSFDLPVYKGWPSKPYVVLGEIYHRDERRTWREREMRDAAKGAKKVGGEAIIIRWTSESGVAAFTGSAGITRTTAVDPGLRPRNTALVIRWQTEAEREAARAMDELLMRQSMAKYPGVAWNSSTSDMIRKYLYQLTEGRPFDKESFVQSHAQILNKVTSDRPEDLTGQWVYKGMVKESGLAAEGKENQFLGLATVQVNGGTITIASTDGKTEMNFSGQNDKGRLTGQVGIVGISCKAEGVALEDKISLSFQALTAGGTAQGSVVLQRMLKSSKPKIQNL
jgi:hypothetical protein